MRLSEPVSGYSTQAGISLHTAALINNGRIRLWFAREFNPIENGLTSNPLRIFEDLDRAMKLHDRTSAKAINVAANLRAWVQDWEQKGLIDRETQGEALHAIKTAFDDGGFRPAVFFLGAIIGAEKGEQPDEYWVESQPTGGDGSRQILPPLGTAK